MPFLRIVGSPEVVEGIKARSDSQQGDAVWSVDAMKPLGEAAQLVRLRRLLGIDEAVAGLPGYTLHEHDAAEGGGGGKGRLLDLEQPPPSSTRALWVEASAPASPPSTEPPASPEAPTERDEAYEAETVGWVPVRRKAALSSAAEYYLPVGDESHTICDRCVRIVGQVESEVLWSDVDVHPKPTRPENAYQKGWIEKLSFKRGQTGEWKVKTLGASWEQRHFRFTPAGLHYFAPEVVEGGAEAHKAKNSKLFRRTTRLVPNPSEDDFPALRGKSSSKKYFGLCFQDPEEALLMRVETQREKDAWVDFLSKTLKQLQTEEDWAADSDPPGNKSVSSNYLARIAELQKLEVRAKDTLETETAELAACERRMASARAETEHLMRNADRGEGEVAKLMARIRVLRKELEAEHREAVAVKDSALADLAAAKLAYDEAQLLLEGAAAGLGEKQSRAAAVRQELLQLRREQEEALQSRRQIFARWRKMEERDGDTSRPTTRNLLAFSHPDSPCHPLRVASDGLGDSNAAMLLRAASAQGSPPRLADLLTPPRLT